MQSPSDFHANTHQPIDHHPIGRYRPRRIVERHQMCPTHRGQVHLVAHSLDCPVRRRKVAKPNDSRTPCIIVPGGRSTLIPICPTPPVSVPLAAVAAKPARDAVLATKCVAICTLPPVTLCRAMLAAAAAFASRSHRHCGSGIVQFLKYASPHI